MPLPIPEPDDTARYALLSHIGGLVVDSHVTFDAEGDGYAGDMSPRSCTPHLDVLPRSKPCFNLTQYANSPSSLDSPRVQNGPRAKPRSSSHSSPLNHSRLFAKPPGTLPGSGTFGNLRLRHSASAEPLRHSRRSMALSHSDPRSSIDTKVASLVSLRRSFHLGTGTAIAQYDDRPESLLPEETMPSFGGEREHRFCPSPLKPVPLSPGFVTDPVSPTDFDLEMVNTYPRPGIGQKIKQLAEKLSFRSLK